MLHALRVSKPSSIAPLAPLPQRPLFVQLLLQPSSFHQDWPSVPFLPGKLPSALAFLVFPVYAIKISYLAFLLPLFTSPLRVSPLHCLTSLPWQGLLLLLFSHSVMCDPMHCSSPGSSVHGISQARVLEWVAISFSSTWKWNVNVKSLSRVQLLAHQAPPPMGFSRQEYWSALPLPSPPRR